LVYCHVRIWCLLKTLCWYIWGCRSSWPNNPTPNHWFFSMLHRVTLRIFAKPCECDDSQPPDPGNSLQLHLLF
jgi:hypothetical protein